MDVREEIKKIVEAEDVISISGIARSCGLSISAVSSYLSGNYQGRNDRVEEALKGFLNRHREREKTRVDLEYVDTSIAKKIHEVADMVHTDCEVGVIAGDAGLGKTFSLRRYAEMNPDVIFIEVDCGYSTYWLARQICRELGLAQHGRVSSMTSEIMDVLRGSKRLLIVDEAEYLPRTALELLRRIHDKAEIGLLLAGLPRLIHNLRGSHGQYAQLYSRVGIYVRLEKLSAADTKALVESAATMHNGTYKAFHRASKGNTRALSKLLRRCVRVAKLNGVEIDKQLIEETAQTLIL